MRTLGYHWRRLPAAVRKPLILVVGATIVVVGLALLVLPGPGWALIFLGFAVLATEFAFAERVRHSLVGQLGRLFASVHRALRRDKDQA